VQIGWIGFFLLLVSSLKRNRWLDEIFSFGLFVGVIS
jgi:hypothetical protein